MAKTTEVTTSVAIITRNRAESLADCLSALQKQTCTPSEVIAIDNGSSDTTRAVIDSFRGKINIHFAYEPEINISKLRNLSISMARGNLILITDDDCLPKQNWVESSIDAHKRYPDAVAIQGRSISIPKNSIYSLIMQKHRDFRIQSSTIPKGGILYLSTDNVSFKREKLQTLNIKFDESIKRSGVDMDLSAKIISKGGKIIYDEKVIVLQKERDTLYKFLQQRYSRGMWPVKLEKKWPNLRFHTFHSALGHHFIEYIKLSLTLLKNRRYLDCIKLPFILFFSIIAFEMGGIAERVKYK